MLDNAEKSGFQKGNLWGSQIEKDFAWEVELKCDIPLLQLIFDFCEKCGVVVVRHKSMPLPSGREEDVRQISEEELRRVNGPFFMISQENSQRVRAILF